MEAASRPVDSTQSESGSRGDTSNEQFQKKIDASDVTTDGDNIAQITNDVGGGEHVANEEHIANEDGMLNGQHFDEPQINQDGVEPQQTKLSTHASDQINETARNLVDDIMANALKTTSGRMNVEDIENDAVVADGVSEQNTNYNAPTEKSREVPQKLVEDTSEKVMDILGNGLLVKKIVTKGDGRRPVHGEEVTVNLTGELSDGMVVEDIEGLTFTLGDGDVITGLELCVPLMELNETCTLSTDSKYAYGSHGNSSTVPPNTSVTYTVTLTTISPAPSYSTMDITHIIQLAEKKRLRGNYYFERGDFSSAITSYTKALHIADSHTSNSDDSTALLQSALDIRVKCYNNLAASQLKIEAYQAAMKSCDCVLKYSSQNVKALFRKAKACSALGQLKEASVLLKKALQLEPESRLIHVELSRITNKLKTESQSSKKMYQKMFGLDNPKSKPKAKQWTTWGWTIASAVVITAVSVGIVLFRSKH